MARTAALGIAVLATAVLSFSPSIPARADSSADEAEARFRHGAELYKRGRFDEALLEFFTSNRLAPNKNVVFNIARSFEALGRFDEAYQYYDVYRTAESSVKERAAAAAKLRELAPRVALLDVTSEPPGATVYIDRKDLGGHGETPATMALAPGAHRLLLERDGFEAAETQVTVKRGEQAGASLVLRAIVGEVRVETRPSAEVRIDRAEDDVAPPDQPATPVSLRLLPGRHALDLRAPGYRPLRRLIVVKPRDEQIIRADLEKVPPASGSVAVSADVDGAEVAIDGKPYGPAPLVGDLVQGRHTVRVSAAGFDPWQREVTVAKEGHLFLAAELHEHEPEVQAATRSAQRVSEAPASVSIVTHEELEVFDRETLSDALHSVRGLYPSDDRNYQAIGIRGFSRPGDYTNRVLVLRDGHTVNDDLVGSGFVGRDFAPDLSDVDRIEVVRGPGSAFYGQGAFFGVVNVVSLAAGEGPALSAGATVLSDGGTRAHVRTAQRLGDTSLTLGVSAYGSSGQTLYFSELADTPSAGFARDDDGENAQRASLRLANGQLYLDATYNRREKDIPTASFDTIFDPAHNAASSNVTERTVDDRATVELRFQSQALLLRLYGDYTGYHGAYPYDNGPRGDFILRDRGVGFSAGAEARVTVPFPSWNRLNVGGVAEVHDITAGVDADGDGHEDVHDVRDPVNAALYAVDELAIGERVRVTVGARLDRPGVTDETVVSPRLAAVLAPYSAGRTKLVLGQAYRAPSDFEQYYSDGGVTQVPALTLRSETIDTAELEHTHELGRGSYLLGTVFVSRIDKLIGLVENPDGKLVYANSPDEVTSVGFELEAKRSWDSGLWVQAAVSLTRLSGGDLLVRANSPSVVASIKAIWSIAKDTAIAAEAVLDGPRADREGHETDAVVLVGLAASGRLAGRHLRWHVAIDNLLDWRYVVPVGDELTPATIQQDGRRLRAGVVLEY